MNVGSERVRHLSKITQQFGARPGFNPDASHSEASLFSHSGEVWGGGGGGGEWQGLHHPLRARLSGLRVVLPVWKDGSRLAEPGWEEACL